jgi:exopolyphosphatase/guanosine-5'-triphosphate,3'-diphosphate pyrophosphatase
MPTGPTSLKAARRAVIDVGTNSVKLLVADVSGRKVQPVIEQSEQTRLGAGFFRSNRLQSAIIADTAKVVAGFVAGARKAGAISLRVIATSAARDATNQADLTDAIRQQAGLKVEIISGEQEADWAFRGVTSDPELATVPLLLLDVGGGSTEFILGQGENKHFCQSFQLGTVRLFEQLPHGDPPSPQDLAGCRTWVSDFLDREVRPRIEPALRKEWKLDPERRPIQLVGAGGTTTIMARMEARLEDYDRNRIEATRLTREQVRARVELLWRLPLAERKLIIGLPEKRADVILPGVVIYERVMEAFDFNELRVSTRGLRFAAVMDDQLTAGGRP